MKLLPTTTRLSETAVAFLLATMLATLATALLELPVAAGLLALGALVPLLAPVALRAPVLHSERGIGAANRITAARAIIIAGCAGLLPYPDLVVEHGWWVLLAAGAALALDGVDGAVARMTNTATDFGARFDMELDAFFIMILCALVWLTEQAGIWVLLIGLMRYAFAAAGRLVPALRQPLPPSLRRKVICVIQVGALMFCLAPPVGPTLATTVAGVALGLLALSFAVDVRWLLRHRPSQPDHDPGEPA
jgi:phosphatidylglycerophosphate synthase